MPPTAGATLETGSAASTAELEKFVDDSLDLSDIGPATLDDGVEEMDEEGHIPEHQMLGSESKKDETVAAATDPKVERAKDGKFAGKKDETTDAAAAGDGTVIPFQYRAMSKTHALEGATQNEAGDVTIPKAKEPELREAFNALHVLREGVLPKLERAEQENQSLRTQLEASGKDRSLAEHQAAELVKGFESMLTEPDEEKAVEAFFKTRDNYPRMKSDAEREYWKNKAEAKNAPAPAKKDETTKDSTTSVALPTRSEAIAKNTGHLDDYKVQHENRDISADDWKQLETKMERTPMAFIRAAEAEDAKKYGVTVGEPVYDTDMLHDFVTEFITSKRSERETAKQREDRAADAARRTQTTVTAPPVPGNSPKPTKGETKASGDSSIKTEKELNDWFNSDKL